jgi:hypothetical protein
MNGLNGAGAKLPVSNGLLFNIVNSPFLVRAPMWHRYFYRKAPSIQGKDLAVKLDRVAHCPA